MHMTEPDLPYITPQLELPPETKEAMQPSPDVANQLPNHEPIEKMETEPFVCPVCGKSFNTKLDLDLHLAMNHKQTKKT
jgi:hypothetical protein